MWFSYNENGNNDTTLNHSTSFFKNNIKVSLNSTRLDSQTNLEYYFKQNI